MKGQFPICLLHACKEHLGHLRTALARRFAKTRTAHLHLCNFSASAQDAQAHASSQKPPCAFQIALSTPKINNSVPPCATAQNLIRRRVGFWKIQPAKPQGMRTRTLCRFLSCHAPCQRAFNNVACNALAICSASRTGTAFPICLYFDVKSPANSSFLGNVCIAAASRQLRRRVSPFFPNLHSSLPSLTISGEDGCKATCFAIAGIVNDTSSQPRFLLRDI